MCFVESKPTTYGGGVAIWPNFKQDCELEQKTYGGVR